MTLVSFVGKVIGTADFVCVVLFVRVDNAFHQVVDCNIFHKITSKKQNRVMLKEFLAIAKRKKSFWSSSETFGFLNLFLQKKVKETEGIRERSRATGARIY